MVTKTSHLPIRYFLALLSAHPILHISTIRVKTALAADFTIVFIRNIKINSKTIKQRPHVKQVTS